MIVRTRSVAVAPSGSRSTNRNPTTSGNQHGDRLAEHRGLGFDPAHAPADDTETVDHRGVRIGTDERVGIRHRLAVGHLAEDDPGEVFEIDLMDDAGVGRDDAEVIEGFLAPAEERVALAVAAELEGRVQVGRVALHIVVDLHGVVDDEFDRLQRVDLAWIAAELDDAVAHGRQVDNCRHSGEVLEQHPGRREGDLLLRAGTDIPAGQRLDVVRIDEPRVLAAQQVLEQDLQRVRQPRDVGKTGLLKRGQAEDVEGVAPDGDRSARVERVLRGHP